MSGTVGSQQRLIKFVVTVAHNLWSWWSTNNFVAHWLNNNGIKWLISCDNFSHEKGNLGPLKSPSMVQCLFDQPLHKLLKSFTQIWFSLKVVNIIWW